MVLAPRRRGVGVPQRAAGVQRPARLRLVGIGQRAVDFKGRLAAALGARRSPARCGPCPSARNMACWIETFSRACRPGPNDLLGSRQPLLDVGRRRHDRRTLHLVVHAGTCGELLLRRTPKSVVSKAAGSACTPTADAALGPWPSADGRAPRAGVGGVSNQWRLRSKG